MKIETGQFYASTENHLCLYKVTADHGETVSVEVYGKHNTAYWDSGHKICDFDSFNKKYFKELSNEERAILSSWVHKD